MAATHDDQDSMSITVKSIWPKEALSHSVSSAVRYVPASMLASWLMLPFWLKWNDFIDLDVAAPTSVLLMCLMRFACSCHLDAAQPAVLMLPPYNPYGCNTWWSWQHVYHCRVNMFVRGLEFMLIHLLFAIFLHLFWQRNWCCQSCCNGMISLIWMLLLRRQCSWCVWCASLTLVISMPHNLQCWCYLRTVHMAATHDDHDSMSIIVESICT